MYCKVYDDQSVKCPYTHDNLAVDFPTTLFPGDFLSENYADEHGPLGIHKLVETTPPTGDVVEVAPPVLQGGSYLQQWVIRDHTPEEQAEIRTGRAAAVALERTRRLALGFDYDFGDGRGIHKIGTTEQDMKGWDEVTKWAQAKFALGLNTDTKLISTDTAPVEITPLEWFSLINEVDSFRGPIWQASFILQSMNPIPANFTDDKYWP